MLQKWGIQQNIVLWKPKEERTQVRTTLRLECCQNVK